MKHGILPSAKAAREFLEKQGYAPVDAQGNKASLAYMLLLLAHCAPSSILPRGIHAVTMLLELEMATHCADAVSTGIMKKLELFLAIAEHTAEILQTQQRSPGEQRTGCTVLARMPGTNFRRRWR